MCTSSKAASSSTSRKPMVPITRAAALCLTNAKPWRRICRPCAESAEPIPRPRGRGTMGPTAPPPPRRSASVPGSGGQLDALGLARHLAHAGLDTPLGPIQLGLLDAVLGGRDKIPADVAMPQGLAPDQHPAAALGPGLQVQRALWQHQLLQRQGLITC